jgi:hypothetical protein
MAANLTCNRLFVGDVEDVNRFKPCIAPENLGRLPESA